MYEQCKMYLEKIPEPLNEDDVFEKYPTEYSECMNTVLMQEVVRYNALLAVSTAATLRTLASRTGADSF